MEMTGFTRASPNFWKITNSSRLGFKPGKIEICVRVQIFGWMKTRQARFYPPQILRILRLQIRSRRLTPLVQVL